MRKSAFGIGLVAASMALAGSLAGCRPAPPSNNEPVAVKDGKAMPAVDSVMTPDGRYVAFQSSVKLTPDASMDFNVYRYDRMDKRTELVTVVEGGKQPGGLPPVPRNLSISDDGRFVTWEGAGSFVAEDTGLEWDVYLRDMKAKDTIRVSQPKAGGEANDGSSFAKISPNGRYVAFQSQATNLVPGPPPSNREHNDVYRWDRTTGAIVRASIGRSASGAVEATNDTSTTGQAFDDGSVLFSSRATNIIRDAPGSAQYRFLHFLSQPTTGTIELAATYPNGDGISGMRNVVMTPNKRWVALTDGNDPRWGFTGLYRGAVILIDRQSGVAQPGPQGSDGDIAATLDPLVLSPDGRWLGFTSTQQVMWGVSDGKKHAYVWDRVKKRTVRLDRNYDGSLDITVQRVHGITDDGKTAAYTATHQPKIFAIPHGGGVTTVLAPTKVDP